VQGGVFANRKTIRVLGAGALGLTIAYAAARRGHRVSVIDKAPLGANASGIAAGMLAPAFESLFDDGTAGRFGLLRAARELWPTLAAELGVELDRRGAMALGARAAAEAWADGLRVIGAEATLVPAAGGRWGALTTDDWRLGPTATIEALYRGARRHGADFVADVSPDADKADALIIATGASQDFGDEAPELTFLTPVKGHILRAAGAFEPGPVLRVPGAYLCRTPQEVILGATMEVGRDDAAVDGAEVARLLEAGAPLTAALGEVKWVAGAGVRAATPDGLPLVGPSRRGGGRTLLAVGARRNGWLLAPMIAGVILDALEGRGGSETAALFDPARFGGEPEPERVA
jgi:glycine oxidase